MDTTSAIDVFVYGTLLSGEASHALLEGAEPGGAARTPPIYHLVDCGPYPAMIPGGATSITGEVYAVDRVTLAKLDVHEGHPVLFHRTTIALEDGRSVQAYLLRPDQARARRRIHSGDWRAHQSPPASKPSRGPWRR
jgi:gamma-glutamylcyclotransferase (GGCT)/AIG2-like uncharacterized protein YtfP